MEQFYAFLKDNIVQQVAVFSSQNEELANAIVTEQGYDNALWVGTDAPSMWASYNGKVFTSPTPQYLFSIGVLSQDPDAPVVEPITPDE